MHGAEVCLVQGMHCSPADCTVMQHWHVLLQGACAVHVNQQLGSQGREHSLELLCRLDLLVARSGR